MDGGYLSIFRLEELNVSEKNILKKYAVGLNRSITSFSIEFDKPKFRNQYRKEQYIKAFGGQPQQEIIFIGLVEPMFMAAEEVLRKFGGFLPMGIDASQEVINSVNGIAIEIFERKNSKPSPHGDGSYLLNYGFVTNYVNKEIDPYLRSVCNLDKYM